METNDLFDLLENNQIENRLDKLIAEKILEAETDWTEPVSDLNNFIEILERETGKSTSKRDLNELLIKYNKNLIRDNSWKSESICSLIEIFEYSGYSNLRTIFKEFSKKYSAIKQIKKFKIFEIKGYPIIKLFETHFEIKAIDYWEYRIFKYSDLKKVTLINPMDKWWNKINSQNLLSLIFSGDDPFYLQVSKIKGSGWKYQCSNKTNIEFNKIILEINIRIKKLSPSV
jgi:hypothetical protein